MAEAAFEYFIHNDGVLKVSEFEIEYNDVYPSVYEVIRVINGTPVFLEEHYERLINSAKILHYNLDISYDQIKSKIHKIIELNNIKHCNIKIVVNNLSKPEHDQYYYFIKSNYPDDSLYQEGITTCLYYAQRQNPNAKVIYNDMREEINKQLYERNCYEALLVNSKDEITEGSRSNSFFIKKNEVYTAPASDVLLGITRQRIIALCSKNNIKVNQVPIYTSQLKDFEAAFISGTSPKVLPISSIGEFKLSVENSLLRKIVAIYDNEIAVYLNSKK